MKLLFAAIILIAALGVETTHAQGIVLPPPEPPAGNPIVQPPAPGPANITVNVTPPPPDPAATQAMYDHFVATAEFDHANVPVSWATGLLDSDNIWTTTPPSMSIDLDVARRIRTISRNVALSLFLLGILWTGGQLAFGSLTGETSYQQLLPMVVIGFLVAWFSDDIQHRALELNNWLCVQLGDQSLQGFSGSALTMPERPQVSNVPGIIGVPAAFFSGVITTLIYAIVLVILEVKLIFRDAVLVVTSAVMPISGALWAFSITRGWGLTLYRLFFGWLYGQPLVVVCLSIASSLFGIFHGGQDSPAIVFVKIAVAFMAIKAISIFASGGLGAGGFFGLASILMLLRRMNPRGHGSSAAAGSGTAPANAAAVQPGFRSGTGSGSAATGRPWRPAYGSA